MIPALFLLFLPSPALGFVVIMSNNQTEIEVRVAELAPVILSLGFCLFALTMIFFVGPLMESRTYNKLTGANTTVWDAMFVQLRVEGSPRN